MKFSYKNSVLSESELAQSLSKLEQYHSHLCDVVSNGGYDSAESSLNLPSDEKILNNVLTLTNIKKTAALKYILVVGIGGSNLGTKAVYDAFFGYYDLLERERFPKMIFLDTQNPDVLIKVYKLIAGLSNKEQIIVNMISKSGGTTETMANGEVIYSTLSNKFGDISDRFVITTNSGSKMHTKALELNIYVLTIPETVGGRYSVLSPVGLFPLSLMGIDIQKLRVGAVKMRELCVNSTITSSPAAISAVLLFQNSLLGKILNDNFIFLPQLESLGKWYRQLMGESVGKDGKGITPTVSIGSTDLHSVGQLYLGGPKNKITTFIYDQNDNSGVMVPSELTFGIVPTIRGKTISCIMQAIVSGTKIAYEKQDLPYMEFVFEGVREEEIGSFMQFKMIEMMYLGHLFGVNAFDQPHVELYKIETKKILEEAYA
ncbi:hypothetical protein COV49_01460 [Candidatus Falkowbacteria bacterium CG11_big_fil_rev_8_21_14_0_20_39_10]|uniref:Glucose-6-phosphate isomerase n=1 Tax=Candidatus Falkowbacteria bacterium CG11_big_fil_rev_8_21_14_0_20_39_10 TaxID=1974570 RepID=A0A2M6K9K1_9BACT|nr:MAG: hypothetical protein COV49_01460 [Candidatus Falkowbacteria bacterium CG11_big_fil_rev_8_21_14_0_20_39_10]